MILKMMLIYYLGGGDFDGGGWLQCTPVVRIKRPECILAELLGIAAWENLGWRITWMGILRVGILWVEILWVEILWGGNTLSGGYLEWEYFGWGITWVENEEEGVHKESQ